MATHNNGDLPDKVVIPALLAALAVLSGAVINKFLSFTIYNQTTEHVFYFIFGVLILICLFHFLTWIKENLWTFSILLAFFTLMLAYGAAAEKKGPFNAELNIKCPANNSQVDATFPVILHSRNIQPDQIWLVLATTPYPNDGGPYFPQGEATPDKSGEWSSTANTSDPHKKAYLLAVAVDREAASSFDQYIQNGKAPNSKVFSKGLQILPTGATVMGSVVKVKVVTNHISSCSAN